MKRPVAVLLSVMLCCSFLSAMAEDVILKFWEGRDDQELLKELCEACAAAHPKNNYTVQ